MEFGISLRKLLYIEWINSKILLHSIGNYIQYPVINHHRKEYEKGHIYMSHLAIQQKLTHCKSTTLLQNFLKSQLAAIIVPISYMRKLRQRG